MAVAANAVIEEELRINPPIPSPAELAEKAARDAGAKILEKYLTAGYKSDEKLRELLEVLVYSVQ